MKKLFYLLFLPFTFLISCGNNDLAEVDLTISLENVTVDSGKFYTVSGYEVSIESFYTQSLNGKNSTVANVRFYFEGVPLVGLPGVPDIGSFSTEYLDPGEYKLTAVGQVLQEDKSITDFYCVYPVVVVEDESDLPSDAPEIGTHSLSLRLTNSSN